MSEGHAAWKIPPGEDYQAGGKGLLGKDDSRTHRQSWDLGYHHAKRRKRPTPDSPFVKDKRSYLSGYKTAIREGGAVAIERSNAAPASQQDVSEPRTDLGLPEVHRPELKPMRIDLGTSRLPVERRSLEVHGKESIDRGVKNMLAAGHQVGDEIGQGTKGKIFRASNGGIMKFSSGDSEARAAHMILKDRGLQELSGIPRIHGVYNTGAVNKLTGNRVFAVHREDLVDFSPQTVGQELFDSLAKRTGGSAMVKLKSLVGSSINHLLKKDIDLEDGRRRALQTMSDGIPSILGAIEDKNARRAFQGITDALTALADRGLFVGDVSQKNIGVRRSTGELVLRDLGWNVTRYPARGRPAQRGRPHP